MTSALVSFSGSGQVHPGNCDILSIGLAASAAAATLILRNNGADGTILAKLAAPAAGYTHRVYPGGISTFNPYIELDPSQVIEIILTASGMTGSPITILVPVVILDTADQVAAKVRAALLANANVAAFFDVGGTGADVVLTALVDAANDVTMNLAYDNDTATGLTPGASSANTTAGVAPVLQVETASVVGTIVNPGDAEFTVTAAGMSNSPKLVLVAVAAADDANAVATKARAALAADPDVASFFTVSGATNAVILTALVDAANDATMNIAFDNGTCTGLTPNATSANTTAGVLGVAQVETATIVGAIDDDGALADVEIR